MKKWYFWLQCLIFVSCGCKDVQLEKALVLAKGNRTELEKVLSHYRDDYWKLESAKFLIKNMPGHYSYVDTTEICQYYNAIDSVLSSMSDSATAVIVDSLSVIVEKYESLNPRKVQDVEIITADFLIHNIDMAFDQWKNGPWARHLNFEQFCEFLLPYKADELQFLDDWRIYMKSFCPDHLDELKYCDLYKKSTVRAAIVMNNNLSNYLKPNIAHGSIGKPVYRTRTRVRIPFGTCSDYSSLTVSSFRSQGIPVVYDYTPQWAYRSSGHSWNVIPGNSGKNIPFGGGFSNPGEPHKLDEKMCKVFRKVYVANSGLQQLIMDEAYVPSAFRSPFIKDVTDEYMECCDVSLNVEMNDRYVYLAVFDNEKWMPVDYSKIENGHVVFKKVGMNTVYLPICYDKTGHMEPVSDPFLLSYQGQVIPIVPDKHRKCQLSLQRKYPLLPHAYEATLRLKGGEFQAACDSDFHDAVVVHRVVDCSATGHEFVIPDSVGGYRFWRYYQPVDGAFCNIAEIIFYGKDTHRPLYGDVIGTAGHWSGNPNGTKEKVFDGDLLTFFDAPWSSGAWVGMDFGAPSKMEKIVYFGRGDGNMIEIGDTYELFYWNHNQWCSLGRQKATGIRLIYKNVPQGALYWLRDLTKGVEERIFTYENGEQVWW